MQLVDKKLIDVNDKVDKYIHGFSHGKDITIHSWYDINLMKMGLLAYKKKRR